MAKLSNAGAAKPHMAYLQGILDAVKYNWETYGDKAMSFLDHSPDKKISVGFPTVIDLSASDPVISSDISFSQRVREGVKMTLTDPDQTTFSILPAAAPAPKKGHSKAKGESSEPENDEGAKEGGKTPPLAPDAE